MAFNYTLLSIYNVKRNVRTWTTIDKIDPNCQKECIDEFYVHIYFEVWYQFV